MAVVLQQEPIECGLACIAMILECYGSNISIDSLRLKFDISLRGTSIAELVTFSKLLNLDATVYLLTPTQLSTIKNPSILHWNGNHYVVLDKVDKNKGYHILDPALGNYWVSVEDISKHFNGYTICFKKVHGYQPMWENYLSSFLKLIWGMPGSVATFFTITLLTMALHALVLLFPRYLQMVIDPPLSSSNLLGGIKLSLIALIVLKVCEAVSYFLRSALISRFEKIFTEYLGYKILNHLLHMPLSFFEKTSQGALYSKFSSIDKTREVLSRGLAEGFVDGVFSILIVGIILIYSLKIGFAVMFFTSTYILFNYIVSKKSCSLNQMQIKARSKESAFFVESLRGIVPIKTFSRENQRSKKWLSLHKNHLRIASKIHFLQAFLDSARILFFGTQITCVVVISLPLIAANYLTLGMLYALLFYTNILTKNISSITSKWFDLKMLSVHSESLTTILSYEKEENGSNFPMEPVQTIRLENVSFRYHPKEPWILKNINLTIHNGECLIIYGSSGHGKSTLFKIMMGLLQPTSGKVYINNNLLNSKNISEYRKKISAVMQNDELFSGTIYDNISFFSEKIDKTRVEECAKLAGISNEIEVMTMKYHSFIGDMGIAISGGQKQRILLARALYFSPDILFLDEAFNNLDVKRERALTITLKNLGITQVIVTHREESLAIADRTIDINQINSSQINIQPLELVNKR